MEGNPPITAVLSAIFFGLIAVFIVFFLVKDVLKQMKNNNKEQ